MQKVRVGVVGVGHLGQHHARIFSEMQDASLQAVVDQDYDRAQIIARRTGTRAYKDCHDILGKVDAVAVAVPTVTHAQVARIFLENGKDVLVEKPISSSAREAQGLVELAADKNLILAVGHLERYNAAVTQLQKIARNPYYIESQRLSPFPARSTDIDVILDLMIHDIDIVLSLVGDTPIRLIRAVGHPVLTTSIDMASAWIEFTNGCVATVSASRVSHKKVRKLRVFQADSYISVDYATQQVSVLNRVSKPGIPNVPSIEEERYDLKRVEPLRAELEEFVQCVRERREPRVSGQAGLNALQLAQRITQSIEPRFRAVNHPFSKIATDLQPPL